MSTFEQNKFRHCRLAFHRHAEWHGPLWLVRSVTETNPMDAKSKFREAVRNREETMHSVLKADDRSKREILEQISAHYHRLAKLLIKYMRG